MVCVNFAKSLHKSHPFLILLVCVRVCMFTDYGIQRVPHISSTQYQLYCHISNLNSDAMHTVEKKMRVVWKKE